MIRRKQDSEKSLTAEDDVGGFKVLEWKLSAETSAVHHFFVKAHSIRGEPNSKKPSGRTLFVTNVPPYVAKENLEEMFSVFGRVVDIYIHQSPTSGLPEPDEPFFPKSRIRGYRVAYVVFQAPRSLQDLLEMEAKAIPPLVLGKVSSGLPKWISSYNSQLIETSVLELNVKTFMEDFERKEIQRKEEEKNNEGQADEDGWVKVTRKGRRPGTARTERTEEALKEKKRKYEKQLLNFTPTQIRETRAKQLSDLKKKFDEDKQRVAMLRQQRKFKPF